eukprot:403362008
MSHDIAKNKDRLFQLTNFTGSSGLAIVFRNHKPVFITDNRYKIQSQIEVDEQVFEIQDPDQSVDLQQLIKDRYDWQNLGGDIMIDGSLFSMQFYENLSKRLLEEGIQLNVNLDQPIIDEAVQISESIKSQSKEAEVKVYKLEEKYSGESSKAKVEKIFSHQKSKNLEAIFVSSPEEVCWVTNLRALGSHEYEPIFNGFLLLMKNERSYLFLDDDCQKGFLKTEAIKQCDIDIEVKSVNEFQSVIQSLDQNLLHSVGIDKKSCQQKYYQILKDKFKHQILFDSFSPISELRVIKNESELKGIKEALKLESAALICFYANLKEKLIKNQVIYEHEGPAILDKIRKEIALDYFLGNSFPMIMGSGPNGAIVHYRAKEGSSLRLQHNLPFLVDTGAQYLFGTTDTTRTHLFDTTLLQKEGHLNYLKDMYTRVLIGNLALQETKFPLGKTYAHQLDALARRSLWEVGEDFKHGVGHGVSHCGPVHEYPHYAYGKNPQSALMLQEGMIITNEPGFYKEGQFGIRIENITQVEKYNDQFLKFKALTLVPYCKNLISRSLLDKSYQRTIKEYYTRIEKDVVPIIKSRNNQYEIDFLGDEMIDFI